MMNGQYGMGGWGFMFMTLGGLLFLALLVVGIVVLVRALAVGDRWSRPGTVDRPGPEEVLADRFARGEIDADEYRHMLDVLRGRTASR